MENSKIFLGNSIYNNISNKSNADLRAIIDEINAYHIQNIKNLNDCKYLNDLMPITNTTEDVKYALSLILDAVYKEITKRFYTITADNEKELNIYNKLCCNDSIYYVNFEYDCIEKGTIISVLANENKIDKIKVSFGDNDISTFPSSCFGKCIFTNVYTAVKYL